MNSTKLKDLAHVRTGDKGDNCILVLIPYESNDFEKIAKTLTANRVATHFGNVEENVSVIPLESLKAFTIVIQNQLDGGVTRSRRVDRHGKTLGAHLLELVLL